MTIFGSQFKKILLLVLILFSISSCEPGCVEADEFDIEQTIVNARPTSDGIIGKYSSKTGGQVANWHDTGLRSNGDPIKIIIGGAWSAWEQVGSAKSLNETDECKICLRKEGVNNCICYNGQTPEVEKGTDGKSVKTPNGKEPDCTKDPENLFDTKVDQSNPEYCTCINPGYKIVSTDTAINRFYYIIALDYQDKNGSPKIPDKQQVCKYDKGMGLYIGLFGTTGVLSPSRAYHLYSIEKICDIKRNVSGECMGDDKIDRTKYLYRPPNDRIFMKDDLAGNDGKDTNPSDDQYHKAKEKIKVIIYDRYYDDNFGYYTLNFISGVQRAKDRGLLEYIVGSVEDVLMGQINTDSNRREGGVIEFIYKALVQDSTIILIIRLCLILYIAIFGIGILAGVVEISKKEIMNRIMKVSLVIFFTTGTSWYWYDQIVVGFFKDSMDSIISMFMGLGEKIYGDDTSMVKISQMLREESASNATRFSYVDLVMKKLFSMAVTKKIWGLFFSSLFGLLYIVVIYFLIGYFVYISATAALIYISAMLKLVFIIALGPIFILSSLFNQTSVMFKKWLSFLGARSLEIILLFITFYLFLMLIDKGFTDLLSFRSCADKLVIGFFSIDTLKAEIDRSFVGWIVAFINLGLLIFLLQTIMSKIAGVSNSLLSISGTASRSGSTAFSDSNSSATGIANTIMGEALSNGLSALKNGLSGAGSVAGFVARITGAGKALEAIADVVPFNGPRGLIRNSIIDKSIKHATVSGKNQGFSGAALEQHVRNAVTGDLAKKGLENSTKFGMLGINQKSIESRLDQKFVQEPLRKFIKSETAKLKQEGKPLFGKEMTDEIKNRARDWAGKNLHDKSSIEDHLRNMKGFMKEQGTYNADEAVKKFSGNPEHRNKYLEHLEGKILKNKTKYNNKIFGGLVKGYRDLLGGDRHNPKRNQEQFLRKEYYKKEQDKEGRGALAKFLGINTAKGWSLNKRIDLFDRKINTKQLERDTKEKVERARVRTEFLQDGYKTKLDLLNNKYNAQKAEVEKDKKANQDRYEAEKTKINDKQSIYTLDQIEKARKEREDGLAVKLNNIENAKKKEKEKLDSKSSFEKEIIDIADRYKAEKERLEKGESPYTLAEIEKMREKEERKWAEKIKDYGGDLSISEKLLAENKVDSVDSDQAKNKGSGMQASINDSIAGNGLDNVIDGFVQGNKTVEDVKAAVIEFNNKQKASVPDIKEALNKLQFKLRDNKNRLEALENKRDKKSAIEEQEILDLKAQIDRDETRLSVETVKLKVLENQQEE